MRRATITFPDDLEKKLIDYLHQQEAPPSLTILVQAALREYLGNRGYGVATAKRLRITPSSVPRNGPSDVSDRHDSYFAEAIQPR
ncbi:MAG: hypothetical protein HY235_03230 [Acidobacteria bacterium]|nr:hypothetical protein [Acidobacteriota bacterium]